LKVTFLVPTRNKALWVERAAVSYLRQTYSPMEIVFFDQGSTDGTLEIVQRLAASYDGPNTVRVLSCPDAGIGGTSAGMNADIEWVHGKIDGEIILWGNADDFAYPARTEKTVEAFREFNPSWVSCCQYFMNAALMIQGETQLPALDGGPKRSRWVEFQEAVRYQVGSSGALAYSRDLWDKYGPMRGIEQNDIVLPYMSFLERGMYFIAEPLHTYVFHASETNQGIGGQIDAAKTDAERLQKTEVNAFNLTSNWMSVLNRLREAGKDIPPGAMVELNSRLWGIVQNWEEVRRAMTLAKIAPVGMHMRAAA
jgi:glycosyltransferase involved in cell wall biosynthesis